MTETHIALLRGINVGGKNRLPMADLRTLFEELGCEDVRTYIQSGNVVFTAGPVPVEELPGRVERAIGERFDLRVPVILRSAAELEEAARANPFLEEGVEEKALHLMFLRDRPDPARVEGLDPERSPPDRFSVRGREVYLCCPNGVARTKLTTGYFDSRLDTVATVRNQRTVHKLLEMAGRG